ncbi:MAG: CRISPR-associated protein Csx11, partial [Gammaproteobacteria bacterium]
GELVRSLAIGTDEKGNWLSKPPTFARVFRIWRTTKQFWKEMQEEALSDLRDDRRRLTISLDREPDLGQYHVYDMDLGPTSMSVAWIPPQDGQPGYLVSTDNLQYTARQLGAAAELSADSALSAIFVEDFIKREWIDGRREPRLLNPEDAAARRQSNLLHDRILTTTDHQDTAYSPVIPILAEPRTFMALVPANKALDIVQAIQTKYAREMGKVRNRLPLHLGLVYFQRRTPLRAALDAGRRMLNYESGRMKDEVWSVTSISPNDALPETKKVLADGTQQFNQTITVKLAQNGRFLTWYVPAVMGDGMTPDNWYPYVFIKGDGSGRNRAFKAPRPKSDGT